MSKNFDVENDVFLTTYEVETDTLEAFQRDEVSSDIEEKVKANGEWVWQYAPDHETAKKQHFNKLTEWEFDPTKDIY